MPCYCYAFGCKCEIVATRGGYRMARGCRYTKPSLSSECICLCCGRVLSIVYVWVPCASLHPTYTIYLSFLAVACMLFLFFFLFVVCAFFILFFMLFSRWSFVDTVTANGNVPLIFSCPADHVLLPDWQPRTTTLLGMVEAR